MDFERLVDLILPGRWKSEEPEPLGIAVVLAVAAWASWCMRGTGWVFPLDNCSLIIHEAGHPIFGMFSERLMVYGGSVFQVGFPLVFAFHFRRMRQAIGFCFCLIWDAAAWHNLGIYVDDARAMGLPLVGNGDRIHDWNEILGRWNGLPYDHFIGGLLWGLSWAMMACAAAMLIHLWATGGEPKPPRF